MGSNGLGRIFGFSSQRGGIYDQGLDANAANYAPLSPLSFLERSAHVYPDLPAVVYGAVRRNWSALVAIPATFLIGVSCGLPLYLFLRTRPV